ncbi:MAG: GNAT family N-acetyltransferase [Phycisphaerales bacterium JB063]
MSGFTIPVDDGLTLRLVEPRHAEEMFAVVDANRAHLARWMPWPDITRSPADSRAYAERSLGDFAAHRAIALSIVLEGKIIGGSGWTDWKNEVDAMGVRHASADIGYWIAADYSGRGLVTRCVDVLTRYAFEVYDMHRLTIRAEPENHKSWGVAERCGYEREGTMRGVCLFRDRWVDHHLYAKINPAHTAEAGV